MQTKKYHLIVMGAGSGGLVAAAGAAGLGAKVALIEKHKMGGDCLNTGCVPSKSIIRSAKLIYDLKTADRFGLSFHSPSPFPLPRGEGVGGRVAPPIPIELSKIMQSVRFVQAKLAPHDSVERFTSLGVDVHFGDYSFVSPRQISNGKEILEAKRFVIATGSSPFVPPIPGLSEIPYLTTDNVWNLQELPRRLVVLGGGPIGAELAQVFARLGSEVHLVEMMDRLLIREDPEVSELIKKRFEAEGINVLLGHKVEKISEVDTLGQILVAVGRTPNVNGLGLEKAGVAYDKKGIKVNAYLQTSAKHIYACGDVASPYPFTHVADFQARLILRNALFPGKIKIDYRVVPWCTFTEPEVARVGLNETEARAQNISVDVYAYSFADLDRAVCDRETEGFIKVLTEKGRDQILGVTLVGSHAGDLLHELALAMHQKIGLKKVAGMIHIYPTLAEISKRIADAYQRSRLTPTIQKWLRRYFQWRWG